MKNLKDLNILTKLSLLVLVTAIGFASFGVIAYSTIRTVKVGGPLFDKIEQDKDLASDIVPPGLYLSEARMHVLALIVTKDPAEIQARLNDYKEAKQAFESAMEKYNRILPPGRTKDLMNGTVRAEAVEWFAVMDSEFLPAKMRGDEKGMLDALTKKDKPHFMAHRKAAFDMLDVVNEDEKKSETDAAATVASRMKGLTGIGIGMLGLVVILGWFTARNITGSLNRTVHVLQAVATGDLRDRVEVESKDESGIMGDALNVTLDKLGLAMQSIGDAAVRLSTASEEFSATSQQISANSEETSAQASAVSAATEEVNRNLQTVATATEEISASIAEIAKSATEAAKVAGEAMRTAAETNTIVGKLGNSGAEIGQVIKVITSIAQKTDLLALNATVEAARAGEVGAGFAVVANEVKELAKQTATATEDISKKIEAIQVDAKGAVEAIQSIRGIIEQVNQISSTIAAAVEEQSATTREMSRNLTEAAKGANEVAQNISGVAEAAQNTSHGATDSQKAARSLAEMSTQLRELVGQFQVDDRKSGNADRPARSRHTPQRETENPHEPVESLAR